MKQLASLATTLTLMTVMTFGMPAWANDPEPLLMVRGGVFCQERAQMEEQVERFERYNYSAPMVEGCQNFRRPDRVPAVVISRHIHDTPRHRVTLAEIDIVGLGRVWGYLNFVPHDTSL